MKEPLVTIACISYNHSQYIRDAIEGFLMQKTNFPVEIRIFDDASTDGTQEIIKEYAKNHANIITFLMTENQWSKGKYGLIDWIFPSAKGKYIALCEGDDYWIDPYKLQKQVDFLEENSDYVICFHKVLILKNKKFKKDYITKVPDETTTLEDLIRFGNFIHTPSVLFRNDLIDKFSHYFRNCIIGDYPLYVLLTRYGKIKYINEVMAVYRIHDGGYWSNRNKNDIAVLMGISEMKKNLLVSLEQFSEVRNILSENLSKSFLQISEILLKKGEINNSINFFKKAIDYNVNVVHYNYFKYKSYLNILINIKLFIIKIKNFVLRCF